MIQLVILPNWTKSHWIYQSSNIMVIEIVLLLFAQKINGTIMGHILLENYQSSNKRVSIYQIVKSCKFIGDAPQCNFNLNAEVIKNIRHFFIFYHLCFESKMSYWIHEYCFCSTIKPFQFDSKAHNNMIWLLKNQLWNSCSVMSAFLKKDCSSF